MTRPSLVLLPTLLLSARAFAGLSAQQGEDPPSEICQPLDPFMRGCPDSGPCDSNREITWWECMNLLGSCPGIPCFFDCRFGVTGGYGDTICVDQLPSDGICDDSTAYLGVEVTLFASGQVPCGTSSFFTIDWIPLFGNVNACCKLVELECAGTCD